MLSHWTVCHSWNDFEKIIINIFNVIDQIGILIAKLLYLLNRNILSYREYTKLGIQNTWAKVFTVLIMLLSGRKLGKISSLPKLNFLHWIKNISYIAINKHFIFKNRKEFLFLYVVWTKIYHYILLNSLKVYY